MSHVKKSSKGKGGQIKRENLLQGHFLGNYYIILHNMSSMILVNVKTQTHIGFGPYVYTLDGTANGTSNDTFYVNLH